MIRQQTTVVWECIVVVDGLLPLRQDLQGILSWIGTRLLFQIGVPANLPMPKLVSTPILSLENKLQIEHIDYHYFTSALN